MERSPLMTDDKIRAAYFKNLHNNLDVLVANFIADTGRMPSNTTVMELMKWSFQKTEENPPRIRPEALRHTEYGTMSTDYTKKVGDEKE